MFGITAAVVVGLILNDSPTLCADVKRLILESASEFAAVRDELVDPSPEEWSTSFVMDGASSCSILVDIESASHLCNWEYSVTSGAGATAYREDVDRVRSCLAGTAVEREDTSVNHPDFWASTFFTTDDGEVSVSLKNKNELGKAFVSIRVDDRVN